jgi:hypothetical protein
MFCLVFGDARPGKPKTSKPLATCFNWLKAASAAPSPGSNPLYWGSTDAQLALLPYWLGAVLIQWAPAGFEAAFARLPFIGMLSVTLASTWYAVYALARHPAAQPVAFAFGGEAKPADYARAMADGGLLALLACLGLARLSHETTPALSQLCFAALLFFGLSTWTSPSDPKRCGGRCRACLA